jgi:nicotinamide phosphoribosyltransferase
LLLTLVDTPPRFDFDNVMILTDSYKVSHWMYLPPGTTHIYSYMESRGGDFPDSVVFFGLQYLIKKYLLGVQVTEEKIQEAKQFYAEHFGSADVFNETGWRHILEKHGGRLPVLIRAVPEGTVLPSRNVVITVVNTDPEVPWLTNWLETIITSADWFGTTVATYSRECKRIILKFLEETGDPSKVNFKLHDFGFRGTSSIESAALGGAGHLINFMGTDTPPAPQLTRKYYGSGMTGFSIPATEHSTITAWGKEHEADAYENFIRKHPTGLVACVIDSYDPENAIRNILGKGKLREMILARDGCFVFRPDSGHPPDMSVRAVGWIAEAFGHETNRKGFEVLNPKVAAIQGDGIFREMIAEVLVAHRSSDWSADNIGFGSGGRLIQYHSRDDLKIAFKASSITVDGLERDVYKRPVTDWSKESKPGRLKLVKVLSNEVERDGTMRFTYKTIRDSKENADARDCLIDVFRDGVLVRDWNFEDIRKHAAMENSGVR